MGNYISEIKMIFIELFRTGFSAAASEALAEVLRILQEEGVSDPNDTFSELCDLYYKTFGIDDETVQEFIDGIDAVLTQEETNNND